MPDFAPVSPLELCMQQARTFDRLAVLQASQDRIAVERQQLLVSLSNRLNELFEMHGDPARLACFDDLPDYIREHLTAMHQNWQAMRAR